MKVSNKESRSHPKKNCEDVGNEVQPKSSIRPYLGRKEWQNTNHENGPYTYMHA